MPEKKRKNPIKKTKRVLDLGKMPNGFVSVDDVIGTNDINDLLSMIEEKRADIDGIVVAWRERNSGAVCWRSAKATAIAIVAMCEIVKQHCIDLTWLEKPE